MFSLYIHELNNLLGKKLGRKAKISPVVKGRVLALTAGGLGGMSAMTQAASSLLPCAVPSRPGAGLGRARQLA